MKTMIAAVTAGCLLFGATLSQGYDAVEERREASVVSPASEQHFRTNQCHYMRDKDGISSINCGKPLNSGPYKKEESYVTFGKRLCTLSPLQGQIICSKLLFRSGRGALKPHLLPG